ncbi:hypothetical protein TNCV_2561261 [Trichonephila clavipes]|uniref:RNase H type-1 domain-containing protein n=1 Tax=Trichonephila clavipes TaxID=2585209 RepID=A0A8X6R6B8_TRICX|nr:hypothetical protein TNCV_2561261 [Trichonephila clavipes]
MGTEATKNHVGMHVRNRRNRELRFNILKDNWGRWKQNSRTLIGSFMARRKPRVLTLGQYSFLIGKFTRAVILSDSRAALLAIVSDNKSIPRDVLDCRHVLKNLHHLEKTIVLQGVSAHCGVPGNEKVDFLANKGVLITQKVFCPVAFYSIKNLIKRPIKAPAHEDLVSH